MLIIDSHLDLAWNALQWNRDLLRSVYTIRTMEGRRPGDGSTVAIPELRKGRVALCVATLLSRSTGNSEDHIDFPSPVQAHATARGHLEYYRGLEQIGHLRVLTQLEDLDRHFSEWQDWDSGPSPDPESAPPLGALISMESADPILSPDQLEEWWKVGVRLIGPAHYGPGRYAGGTGTERGLTESGTALLSEMERLGVALDLTHLTDQAFWQALEQYSGPVLASHQNCRALVPHQRQFTDEQLRAIIERDGVIGAAFDNWMLKAGWVVGKSDPKGVSLNDVVDHIDHVCQLAGNTNHAAIGTDLDGGFGRDQSPGDLDTIADLQMLRPLLSKRGYKDKDIAAIFHGNWLRFLRVVLGR